MVGKKVVKLFWGVVFFSKVSWGAVPDLSFDTFIGAGYLSSASASYSLGGKLGVMLFDTPWKSGGDVSIEIFQGGSLVHTLAFLEYELRLTEQSKRSVDLGVAAGPAAARIPNSPGLLFSSFAYLSVNQDLDPLTEWLFLLKVGMVTGYFNVGVRVGFKFWL